MIASPGSQPTPSFIETLPSEANAQLLLARMSALAAAKRKASSAWMGWPEAVAGSVDARVEAEGEATGQAVHGSFTLLPWQLPAWQSTDFLLLLTGSAGGGKSRIAAEKLHHFCLTYPHSTAYLVRKTKHSLVNSTLLLLERKVLKGQDVVFYPSKNRFEYANGSVLTYGGMADEEQREHIRSIGQDGALDFVWMEEANEFAESDFNEIIARVRGKAAPWRQVLLTTNPDSDLHWIHQRLLLGGEARVVLSTAEQNPFNPVDYVETLGRLTGLERERLAMGRWVRASGLVYEEWQDGEYSDDPGNVTEAAEYVPGGGPVFWACDDGYAGEWNQVTRMFKANSHPRVFLLAQLKGDGHLDVFWEHYRVKVLTEVQIAEVVKMCGEMGWPLPEYAAVDKSAAEMRGRLQAGGVYVRKGPSSVEESIKCMRSFVTADDNKWRRVRVNPRCRMLRSEMSAYKKDSMTGDPVKEYDHGPDALRYLCWTLRFERD